MSQRSLYLPFKSISPITVLSCSRFTRQRPHDNVVEVDVKLDAYSGWSGFVQSKEIRIVGVTEKHEIARELRQFGVQQGEQCASAWGRSCSQLLPNDPAPSI